VLTFARCVIRVAHLPVKHFRRAVLFFGLGLSGSVVAQPVTQPFTFNVVAQSLPAVRNGSVAWADYDGDGDLDALVSGRGAFGLTTAIYQNEGTTEAGASFLPVQGNLRGLAYANAAWADFDGDGDLDLAISGSESIQLPYAPVTLIYRNDGGSFSPLDNGSSLPAYHSGALAWGDYDNDGDRDLLVTGVAADGSYRSTLAQNSGSGSFVAVDPGIPGFAFGDAKWGDYDADGDSDLLISGVTDAGFRTQIYRNDAGRLVDSGASFRPLAFSSVDWGDYDADGDLDVVISGGEVTPRIFEGVTQIYRNTGGSFGLVGAGITGTLAGKVTWGDYDNDGDLDLLTLGAESALGRRAAHIFRNDGEGIFVRATFLIGAIFASADWGDFDGDGDLDLLASGATSFGENVINLYENNRQAIPDGPEAPSALRARQEGPLVMLEWDAPGPGVLTYDLRIGTSPGESDIWSAPADPASGFRRIGRPGFSSSASTFVKDLEAGRYYWSVQAIDPTFAASSFSAEGQFDVTAVATGSETDPLFPASFALKAVFPNPFSQSATIEFDLPEASQVSIRVYDVLGRQATVLVNRVLEAGSHTTLWNGSGALAGGLYFVEMRSAGFRATRTLTFLRRP
jgi:VCBS repeat protein/type IX secretion system substrate protein